MSAILSSDDLNDFISPGVACIKPVETLPPPKPIDHNNPYQVTTEDTLPPEDLPPAQVSLTDCLACSGCVTSAEAILVSLQSHAEVLNTLDKHPSLDVRNPAGAHENDRIFVASVSPQTRASIAATYGVSQRQAGYMIEQLLGGELGLKIGGAHRSAFQWVIDTNRAREACLVLGADEVTKSMLPATKDDLKKPILTSSCPGWICYAEKTHPFILPHLSRLKSPQALTGTLIKSIVSRKYNISPKRIWHVAIMPCFDKKLEASREELTDSAWNNESEILATKTRDVDCVITTKELLMLATSRNIDFSSLPKTPSSNHIPIPDPIIDHFLFSPNERHNTHVDPAALGTSGGNLYYILQSIASTHPHSEIRTIRGRNADVIDYTITDILTNKCLFKAARYYGFRNIQNLVRKLKPDKISKMTGRPIVARARKPVAGSWAKKGEEGAGKSEYAYVEVMACPGGCTNGGGQIKPDDPVISGNLAASSASAQEQKAWLAQVDEAYFSADEEIEEQSQVSETNGNQETTSIILGIDGSKIRKMMEYWSTTTSIPLDKLAYTTYREVLSDVGKKVSETERVVEISSREGGGW